MFLCLDKGLEQTRLPEEFVKMVLNVAAITVGQSPREDILAEIETTISGEVRFSEVGVLDDLSDQEIAQMEPIGNEPRLCTRLRDGRDVVTSKAKTGERLSRLLEEVANKGFDETVLLCTGYFKNAHCSRPYIESQRLIDNYVAALAFGGRKIGVVLPSAKQTEESRNHAGYEVAQLEYASPYSGANLLEAGRRFSDVDLIVMHCLAYPQHMRRTLSEVSGKPVVLARNVVAAGIDQLI